MTTREPAVAGYFYPNNPKALREQIDSCLETDQTKQEATAIIVPHAGYIYSGSIAGAAFSRVEFPSKIFILSPNHTGLGAYVSINQKGEWKTPLGKAKIDEKLATLFMQYCSLAEEDSLAHEQEHSLEVQIPFLQILKKDFQFVPLTIQHLSFVECVEMGEVLAQTIIESNEKVLIIASTDMNHYESQKTTLKKDQIAIDPILEFNPEKLYQNVHQQDVTMCGVIPTTITLIAAKHLGAKKAELIKHATSGDVSGDYEKVVGYASFIVS